MLTFLPWDTAHFGRRMARADLQALDPASCVQLLEACRRQAIGCLHMLVDCVDQATIYVLQANGFDFVDIGMILARPLEDASSPTRLNGGAG